MSLFRSLKSLFLLQAIIGAVLVLVPLAAPGLVCIHYPRVVHNDPLLAPIMVKSVLDDTITLADGRTIKLEQETAGESLDALMKDSDFRVDVERVGDNALVIYVMRRGWLCGTPWVALIQIPLIADEVPINHRMPVGLGHLVNAPNTTQGD
jgi:hypothetical protein